MTEEINLVIKKHALFDGEIVPELNLKDDLAIDILGLVELIADLEDELNITLTAREMDPFKMKTVSDLYNIFNRNKIL